MPQHINLLDASFDRQREWLGSATAALAVGATLGVVVAAALTLQTMSARSLARADQLGRQLAALQVQGAHPGGTASSREADELSRLRAIEAGQQRLRAALDSGAIGARQGYSEYLLALSRQTKPALWLTGFTVAPDGHSLDITGRMTDPQQLPDYLRRLNAEPLFRGREFAQLSLKAPTALEGADPSSAEAEFALRADLSPASVGPK